METAVSFSAGGRASLVAVSGVHVTLRSDKPFPPGAPVVGTLHAPDADRAFTIKVSGSKKIEESLWEVRGRLIAATSDVLAAFARGCD